MSQLLLYPYYYTTVLLLVTSTNIAYIGRVLGLRCIQLRVSHVRRYFVLLHLRESCVVPVL